MRVTTILYRQHIDRMFKAHWQVQGKRVPLEDKAETYLKTLGIPIFDPKEVVRDARKQIELNIVGFAPKPIPRDETHPDWHDKVCYTHRDNNVLLLGLEQAKKLTNTVEIQEGLPEIELQDISRQMNNRIQELVMSSHIFDTEQKKLPKLKDPNRPAWNYPRILGITCERKCKLLVTKLLQECESASPRNITNQRIIMNDALFSVPLRKEDENILLEMSAQQVLMSKKPLSKITTDTADNINLPELHPIHHLNTLVPENIYNFRDIYPVKSLRYHPHTVYLTYDTTKVRNLFEEEVTEPQILGRSLMKTFTVAASYARAKFGSNVKLLPEAVSVQCVHTDGKYFHFGMLQLNTLDLDEAAVTVRNIWFHLPRIPLFTFCGYKSGVPTLENCNPDVIKYLLAFYKNE